MTDPLEDAIRSHLEGQPALGERVPIQGLATGDHMHPLARVEHPLQQVEIPGEARPGIHERQLRATGTGQPGRMTEGRRHPPLVQTRHHQRRRIVERELQPPEQLDGGLPLARSRGRNLAGAQLAEDQGCLLYTSDAADE